MARRQEQESARREVEEVAPGVLRMQLPIRMPGLGHVNMYALLDDEGAAVVDPGLPGPATWKAIVDRLGQAGLSPRHIHTVLVTHSHPDHFGGAARLVRASGGKVIAHESFRFGVAASHEPEVSVEDLAAQGSDRESAAADPSERPARPTEMPRRWNGATPWGGRHPRPPLMMRLRWRAMRLLGRSFVPPVTHPIREGDVLRLAGREWFVQHTPGHTEDHFCLHDPAEGVFLAGDHVLPSITPHISGISSQTDPLNAFFESLERVAATPDVRTCLPAHGHPFDDLAGRCRAIREHHIDRLEKVKGIGRALGPASVEAFSQKLFQPRSWGAMAESETYAHLEHLRIAGDALRRADHEGRFIYETG
jgi:glyoxylase-like metal-dependent hydrolase (beta-lactamase superfamily II)